MTMFPGSPEPQSSRDTSEISLGKLVAVLKDHKWWIIGTSVMFMLIGYFYSSSQPRVYLSDAMIQIEETSPTLSRVELTQEGPVAGNTASAELEILKSRMVMGGTVDRLDLTIQLEPRRMPVIGDFLVEHGLTRQQISDTHLPWLGDWLAEKGWWPSEGSPFVWAGEEVHVTRFDVPDYRIGAPHTLHILDEQRYEVRYEDRPVLSGLVGEPVHGEGENEGYRTFITQLEAPAGAEFNVTRVSRLNAINQLASRFAIVPMGLDSGVYQLTLQGENKNEVEDILNTVTEVFLTQNINRQSEEAEKQISFLNEQIPDVNTQLMTAENNLNSYRAQRDSVDLTFETQSLLNSLVQVDNQLSELKLAEADLAERFTANHPNYQSLLRKRAQLTAEKDALEAQVANLPETQQEVLRLTRDTEVNQQIYVQLLNQLQEMRLVKAGTVGNVRILDPAVLQPAAIAPKIPFTSLVSAILGAMLGVLAVVMKMVLNRAVETPEQLEEEGLSVYATLPASAEQTKMARRVRQRRAKHGQNVFSGLLAQAHPADISVEALRGLRTSLYFAMLESRDNRLMIAGTSPEVGKSFVSANLAVVCAQAGQRVLVVDGDMRKGHLHLAFRGQSSGGLSELLAQRIGLDDAIRHSDVEGLDYISRGTVPPNPSELLMQRSFHDFLEQVSERYDLVIIDTPPVLAVTDAAVIGKQVGTSLMVARYGKTPTKEIRAAKRRLDSAGVRLKGAILNGMERTASATYGYYGDYHYAYK